MILTHNTKQFILFILALRIAIIYSDSFAANKVDEQPCNLRGQT